MEYSNLKRNFLVGLPSTTSPCFIFNTLAVTHLLSNGRNHFYRTLLTWISSPNLLGLLWVVSCLLIYFLGFMFNYLTTCYYSFLPSHNKLAKIFGFLGIAFYSIASLGCVLAIMIYLIVFVPWLQLVPQADPDYVYDPSAY